MKSKPTKKRSVKGAGARAKGARAEREFVDICRERGLTAQRVLASGSFVGAKGDIKVGITNMLPDGEYPADDESSAFLRVEVKNRADNPEFIHLDLNGFDVVVGGSDKRVNETIYKHLNQDAITKAVVLKRAKTPQGALKDGDYNQAYLVCMGADDFIKLVKQAMRGING